MKTTEKERNVVVGILAIAGVLWLLSLAPAGDLDPPSAPGPTMHTLDEVYNLHAPPPAFETSVDRGTTHIFMKVEGIDGEAQEQAHKDWCNVISFKQAHAMISAGGGTREGDVAFEEIRVVKPIDKASPKLALAVCNGTTFATVKIHVTGSYGGSKRLVKYYGYELLNVRNYRLRYQRQWSERRRADGGSNINVWADRSYVYRDRRCGIVQGQC